MEFQVEDKFYKTLNISAKLCLYLGMLLVDLAMKLAGYKPSK